MLKPNQPNSIFISARYCTCTKMKIGEKSWRIVVICQIRQSFFPSKVFYYTVHEICNIVGVVKKLSQKPAVNTVR